MEEPAIADNFLIEFVLRKGDVRAGLSVKAEFPITVRQRMHKRQRGMHVRILQKAFCLNAAFPDSLDEKIAEAVLPHLADKRTASSEVVQHCKNVARRAARIDLKERIALRAHSRFGKVDQKFAERNNIILFHGYPPREGRIS